MYQLNVESDLNLSHHQDDLALRQLISDKVALPLTKIVEPNAGLFWDAKQFQLDRSTLFKQCSKDQQQRILQHCNDMLMADFYFLEKSGLAYCAKMILLAETTEARQLYGLIAGDEATHLEWFSYFVRSELRTQPKGKLLPVLGKIIEDCDVNTLYYLVQTLIEGWGVFTYKTLSISCQSQEFKRLLNQILKDEALHHQSGVALFCAKKINAQTSEFILDKMKAYAEVFRVGPQTIVQCIEKELGELNLSTLEHLFKELKSTMISTLKLQCLKSLMNQPDMGNYLGHLENTGYFNPYNPLQCAKIYQKTRGLEQFI